MAMANRIKVAVSQTILTLHAQGWSFRRIARTLGIHRETVSRYVRALMAKPASNPAAGSEGQQEPKPASNPTLGSEGSDRPKPANPTAGLACRQAGNSGPKSSCDPYYEEIEVKLRQGLSGQRIWQDLAFERGFTGSYSAVKRFIRRLGKSGALPFRRMETLPGQEAQVDFGRGAPVIRDGKRRYPWVFRIVLSYSRKAYSEAVWRQDTETFLRCLENAFRAFGGVPRTLVPDNLKAAVLHADWYDPELNPKIQEFCRHYGCVLLPTKPDTPRHKGKIERGVGYVSSNALKGRVFESLQQENEALQWWEAHVADPRIHGTTRKQVRALFQEERPSLLPLPAADFPFFYEAQRAVHRDAHVEVDKAYYSVPPEYLGHVVWVRWDAKMVHIFNGRMEQIAVHVRHEPGRFSTDPKHIASQKISGVERGAGYLLKRISYVGPQTLQWAQRMLDQRGIEGVRVLQGLLAMTGKYPADDLEKACALALSHGAFRLRVLRALMKRPQRQTEFVQAHPLIRPMEFYGRYFKVSFGKEDNGHGEFIALRAPSGEEKGKSPDGPQALSAVQPPASALGSLSSGALSSEPAEESLPAESLGVNTLERSVL
jgi:transposase